MDSCPSEEQLAGYVEGMCAADEAARIGAHVEKCAACAQWVAEAKANEAILGSVRRLPDGEGRGQRGASSPADVSPSEFLPQTIEGYEFIRELHRGGQGVVYLAVQKSTKRKVAVKVLLEGPYASKTALRRFQREIELVASLKHANIISIFHSGRTSDGRQFCVMDYVRGLPIRQYVQDKKLTLEEALKLFTKVCDAVDYAHQKGVVHRDLKPSNILVDGAGVPKVLDFGLAKTVGGPEQTLISMTGQVIGTLPYMSPEQARGNPDEIDIRTDVYALGVVVYEMLTGGYPYPVVGQMAEVLKHINETAPTPPSRSWKSGSGVTQRSDKHVRAGRCPIDAEVETIILRTLTKDRDRRYQNAGELARDLGRYLRSEPIPAEYDSSPQALWQRLRKHCGPAGFALTIACFIMVAVLATVHYLEPHSSTAPDPRETHEDLHDAPSFSHSDPVVSDAVSSQANHESAKRSPSKPARVLLSAKWTKANKYGEQPPPRQPGPSDVLSLHLVAECKGEVYVFCVDPKWASRFDSAQIRFQECDHQTYRPSEGLKSLEISFQLNDGPGDYDFLALLVDQPIPEFCQMFLPSYHEAILFGSNAATALETAIVASGLRSRVLGSSVFTCQVTE